MLLLCAGYAILTFAWYLVWRAFMAERSPDEAIFENVLWSATHGRGLRTSLEGGLHHLGVHFSPVVYALVPAYWLVPSMVVPHLVVSLCTAGAGFVLYRFARGRLGGAASALVGTAFLLHPTVVLQTFMEFHEQALTFLPLALVLLCAERGRTGFTWLAALALLAVREDNALFLLALALYLVLARRRATLAALLAGTALAWLALYAWLGVSVLGGGQVPGVFANTYPDWGRTPAELLRNVASHPLQVFRHVLSSASARYLAQILLPLLVVLPFGSGLVWTMLPHLAMILLAAPDSRLLQVRMHYSIVPVTLLYAGAIGTLGGLARRGLPGSGPARRGLVTGLAAAMLVASCLTVPVWFRRAVQRLNPYVPEIRRVLAVIPDSASVTAPGYLLNQLASRPLLAFAWNDSLTTTEYVVLEDSSRFFFPGRTTDVFYSPRLASLLQQAGYGLVLESQGWYVWRRQSPVPEASARPGEGRRGPSAPPPRRLP